MYTVRHSRTSKHQETNKLDTDSLTGLSLTVRRTVILYPRTVQFNTECIRTGKYVRTSWYEHPKPFTVKFFLTLNFFRFRPSLH
jgi:hypothetical protein